MLGGERSMEPRSIMAPLRSDKMPPVGAAVTPFPYFVEETEPLEAAQRLMRERGIRHVPVLRKGQVVGIVSARDPKVVVRDPYVVEIATPLDVVVSTMWERRTGSAVVVKRGKLAGILSAADVCRVLAELL